MTARLLGTWCTLAAMPSGEREALEAHLKRVGAAKAEAEHEDSEFWLSLPMEERLSRLVQHCAATRRLFPPDPDWPDDEEETWARINAHLRSLG